MQRSAMLIAVGAIARASLCNVSNRVCAEIAIAGSVGSAADANGIHDQDHGAHVGAISVSCCRDSVAVTPVVRQ
jgi:hypothetical protein